MKNVVVILIALCMVFSSSIAFGAQDDEIDVLFDALVFRPLGLGATILGSAAFVVSLPIALITQSTDVTAKTLVVKPFDYTFIRPIGEIQSNIN
jgi:hypothetical protein